MSRTRIVKGNITKIIGGNYKRYSKEDIVNIGSKVIQVGKEGGVTYGEPEEVPLQKNSTVLIVEVKGEKESLPGKEITYKVTRFNIQPTEEDKKRIRWVVKVDDKKEKQSQQGMSLKLKIKKEWVGKEILVMPYLQRPTESVSAKTKVEEIKFPILIARSMRRAGITKDSGGNDVTREDITNLGFLLPGDKEKLRTKLNDDYDKLGYKGGWLYSYSEKKKSRVEYALNEIENYNKKTNAELFKIMINDLDDWAMGDLDDNLVKMVKFFKVNKSSSNNYEDIRLTKAIAKHTSTKKFINQVAPLIGAAIQEAKGDIALLKVEDDKTQFTNKDLKKDKTIIGIDGLQKLDSLKYSDKFSGLGISVNGIQAYNIYLVEFKRVGNNYKGKFKLEILDHFGLDGTDILGDNFYDQEEFTCWYILQHLRNYKPFITKIEISYSFTGSINSRALNIKRDEL